jgi:hypothetical protein
MNKIVQEGLTLKEAAGIAFKNKIPVYFNHAYGTSERKIIEGLKIEDVKIWFPKKYRTFKDNLDLKTMGGMKLKSMIMYNGEKAYFLVE